MCALPLFSGCLLQIDAVNSPIPTRLVPKIKEWYDMVDTSYLLGNYFLAHNHYSSTISKQINTVNIHICNVDKTYLSYSAILREFKLSTSEDVLPTQTSLKKANFLLILLSEKSHFHFIRMLFFRPSKYQVCCKVIVRIDSSQFL